MGTQRVLMFQFGGQSSQGLPPGGQWRCMDVARIRNIQTQSGDWHTGFSHLRPQTCIAHVDIDVLG
jgi:hypothetical protein